MRAGALILGAAAALALAGAPAAAVAPGAGWGPDLRLASSVDAFEPALAAMSLDDDAIVGWTRQTSSRSVRVRLRQGPRGPWSSPVSLGPGRLAALAMDRDGDALALRVAGSTPPRAARIRRDGTVVGSQFGPGGTADRVLGATLRQDGRAVALILRPDGSTVRMLVQTTAGGPWAVAGADLPVPSTGTPAGVELAAAMNRAGQAVVAWVGPGRQFVAGAARYALAGQWRSFPAGLPNHQPPGPNVGRPQAVIGDDGSSTVTWTVFSQAFPSPDRGAGSFITDLGPGPVATASALPVFGPIVGTGVSPTGTAMIAWTDPLLGGNLFAGRFSVVGPGWPIGIRLVASAGSLDEGAFALTPVTSRRGPVLLEASLETGPGPDGQVAFARDSRGAPWGALRRLASTRGTPAVAAGERAGLIALAVDDTGDLVVTPYDRLPRVTKLTARRTGGRMVVSFTLSRPARMTGTIRSLGTGSTVSIVPRSVGEGKRTVTLNPVAPGRYRLHFVFCSEGQGCAPVTRIVAV